VARPILLRPDGGPVEVAGALLVPVAAPFKIDVWRHVRHPPPELFHIRVIKPMRISETPAYAAGDAASLIGKVISWTFDCAGIAFTEEGWRVRVDVRQDGRSVEGYPVEYTGPSPRTRTLAELRIAEPVHAVGDDLAQWES
jgi:hypothetical protein